MPPSSELLPELSWKEEHKRMIAAGMYDGVRKPYRFSEIYDTLARQLGLRGS